MQATEQATQGSGKKASQNGLLHPQYCESVYKSLRRPTRTIEVTRASLSLGSTLYNCCRARAKTHETSLLNQLKPVHTSIMPLTTNSIAGWQCESRQSTSHSPADHDNYRHQECASDCGPGMSGCLFATMHFSIAAPSERLC